MYGIPTDQQQQVLKLSETVRIKNFALGQQQINKTAIIYREFDQYWYVWLSKTRPKFIPL
jgi:hypothetical protein